MLLEMGPQRLEVGDPALAELLPTAHAQRLRPRCLCTNRSPEMYIARVGSTYLIKRMPYSGLRHAPDCRSHEPIRIDTRKPRAIEKDPNTGLTTLRLGFALTKIVYRHPVSPRPGTRTRTQRSGERLELKQLLAFLWEQAGLNIWHPSFEGKRTWAVVRHRLLHTANNVVAQGHRLTDYLYLPEPFKVEQAEAIATRRNAWFEARSPLGSASSALSIGIGELKRIDPVPEGGCALTLRQLPDRRFWLQATTCRELERQLADELARWPYRDGLRPIVVFTFSSSLIPRVEEIAVSMATSEWLLVHSKS